MQVQFRRILLLLLAIAAAALGYSMASGSISLWHFVRESGPWRPSDEVLGNPSMLWVLGIDATVYLAAGMALLVASVGMFMSRGWGRALFERVMWYGAAWYLLRGVLSLVVAQLWPDSPAMLTGFVGLFTMSVALACMGMLSRSSWFRGAFQPPHSAHEPA